MSTPTPDLAWSNSAALRGVVLALPSAALTLVDVETGLAAALGVLPAAAFPLPPRRRARFIVAVIGTLAGLSLLAGALLGAAGAWLAVPGLFVLGIGAAQLAARVPAGKLGLLLAFPLVGAGLSYGTDVGAAASLTVVFVVSSVYAWLVSLAWPEPDPLPTRPAAPLPSQTSMLDFGIRLGLAAAVCAAVGFALDLEHVGWATAAATMVMRPDAATQELRSVGRAVSVCVGAVLAGLVVRLDPQDWVYAVVAVAAIAVLAATVSSRWYITAAFTTYLVFLLLLHGNPDDTAGRFWERTLETLLGIGVAFVFGVLVPLLTARGKAAAER